MAGSYQVFSDDIAGITIKTSEGRTYSPAWAQVLELELQLRKRAFKRASQSRIPIKQALIEARGDDTLLRKHFFHAAYGVNGYCFYAPKRKL